MNEDNTNYFYTQRPHSQPKPFVNWEDVPTRYRYFAIDGDGTGYVYENKPTIANEYDTVWDYINNPVDRHDNFVPSYCNWRNSLVDRESKETQELVTVAIPTHITIDNRRYKLTPIGDE
jgi:hypothetical protein